MIQAAPPQDSIFAFEVLAADFFNSIGQMRTLVEIDLLPRPEACEIAALTKNCRNVIASEQATITAAPMTSAGRFWPVGPIGVSNSPIASTLYQAKYQRIRYCRKF